MGEKRERKGTLLTIRVTDEEAQSLDYLSDCLGKTKSEAIMRACMFFLSLNHGISDDEKKGKERKTKQIHLRVTDADMDKLTNKSDEINATISQIVRKSIKEFDRSVRNHY